MSSTPEGRALPFPLSLGSERPNVGDIGEQRELADEQIVAQICAGESAFLYVLFDRYSKLVMNIALNILRDRGEAEEIVQEVFFYVYRKAKLFDPSRALAKTWIVQLAYHLALDRRSYLGRRGFYAGTETDDLTDTLAGVTDLEREIGEKLSRAQLEKAFKQLPEMQRRTLELYYFEGLELSEISEKLSQPIGNVRHYYYRGLERLRKSAIVRKIREK